MLKKTLEFWTIFNKNWLVWQYQKAEWQPKNTSFPKKKKKKIFISIKVD